MDLINWTKHYLDNVHAFKGAPLSMKRGDHTIECTYAKGKKIYQIEPELDEKVFSRLSGESVLVCLNSRENLEFLISHWGEIISYTGLKVMFVNPVINEQWSLFPKTHDAITDKESLRKGLESLFASVPEI